VEHAGQLVNKEPLFAATWPGIGVGEAMLNVCIGELRSSIRLRRSLGTEHDAGADGVLHESVRTLLIDGICRSVAGAVRWGDDGGF
jgi:hypothetical protein